MVTFGSGGYTAGPGAQYSGGYCRCPIHCKGLLLARGQLASSGRQLWAGQVPFPGENISRLGKGEHWAWQALQGITRIPLPNQPVLRLARSIQMRSTENGPSYSLAYSLSELETLAGVPIFVKSRTSFPHCHVRENLAMTRSLRSDNVSLSSPCFNLRVSN